MALHFKKTVKRLAIGILLVFGISLVLGAIFYKDVEDEITKKVETYIAQLEYGDLEIETMELSIFRHFPNISVQLKQVNFFEKAATLRTTGAKPILSAERINLAFNSWKLITDNSLVLNTVSSDHGIVNIITYEDNKTNLERALTLPQLLDTTKTQSSLLKVDYKPNKILASFGPNNRFLEQGSLSVILKDLYLEDYIIKYSNPSENYDSEIILKTFDGEIQINDLGISCDINSNFEITKSAQMPIIAEQGPLQLSLKVDFLNTSEKIKLYDGKLNLHERFIDIKGTYDHKNGKHIDIVFDASSNDLVLLSKIVKKYQLLETRAVIKEGEIILDGHIEGKMEETIPNIDIDFGINNLSLMLPNEKVDFHKIGFEGKFENIEGVDFSKAKLTIKNLRGTTPGGAVSGNFLVSNFNRPYIKSDVKLSIDLAGLDDIFHLSSIDSLQGKLKFTSNFDGRIQPENESTLDSIGSWSLNMDAINFKYLPSNKFITKLQGTISDTKNEIVIDNLNLFYDQSDVLINGQLQNLYQFIFNKDEAIEAFLTINSNQIFTSDFIFKPNSIPALNDRISGLKLTTNLTLNNAYSYEAIAPKLSAEIVEFSFDLDKLPGIKSLTGTLQVKELNSGFDIDLTQVQIKLPHGSVAIDGKVLMPSNFETLDIKTNLNLTNLPEDYIWDLILELSNLELNQSNLKPLEELTVVSGNLNLSAIMELFPFAMHSSQLTSEALDLKLPDGNPYNFENLNLKLDSLYFNHDESSRAITGIRKTLGVLKFDAFDSKRLKKSGIAANFIGNNDKVKIDIFNKNEISNNEAGYINIDISETLPSFEVFYELKDISAESLLKDYNSKIEINGDLNASLKFSGIGSNLKEMSESLKGNIEISSDSLIFNGIDLDAILKKYHRSQKFNLADVSAFVLAGPFGAVVTKGSDFTRLIAVDFKPEDKTVVSKALASWSLKEGVLQSEDVAFRTNLNRIAFKGSLDIAKDSIPGFTVYVVDKNGCSLMKQTISGKTDDIQVGKLQVAKTLLGSVINLVNKVVGANCETVYNGEVSHPKAKN